MILSAFFCGDKRSFLGLFQTWEAVWVILNVAVNLKQVTWRNLEVERVYTYVCLFMWDMAVSFYCLDVSLLPKPTEVVSHPLCMSTGFTLCF